MSPIRFLFFLYYYPPVLGTAAKRNERISSALAQKAERAHIFTAADQPTLPQANHVSVFHIQTKDYRNRLRRKYKDGAIPEAQKQSLIARFLIRLINSFPLNILIGEGGFWYTWQLIRQGQKRVRKEGITHLYSSYRPVADHYAAYCLKKWNPHLIWIADFRDLIIDPHTKHIFFPGLHRIIYGKMFRCADVLTTVSDGLAKHLQSFNPNVVTLRNGVNPALMIPAPVHNPVFTIVYTGSMFLQQRNPMPLFEALSVLIHDGLVDRQDLRMVYAGKDGAYWRDLASKYHMTEQLEDHGIVSSEEAQRLQQYACINLLLTISSDQLQGVMTGKIIEYLESGSPVLGIITGQNDPEIRSILQELSIGDTYSDQPADLNAIKAFILREYQHWKQTGHNRKPVDVDLLKEKYSMEHQIEQIF